MATTNKDTSKLLIDEPPLQVLPTLACKIGLNGAIILQQVHYWLLISKKAKDDRKFIDGRWWVYNTYEEWQENFPWWSLPTIKRTILKLEECKLLVSREMNAGEWDHTKWYSIDYDALNDLTDCIKMILSDESDGGDPLAQDESILNSITETTTETTSNTAAKKRGDPLDGILDYHLYPKSIKDAVRDFFKLTPSWETKFNRQFMQWAVGEKINPEQIQAAAALWGKDKRFNWSVPTLKGIQEHWLELMTPTGAQSSTPAPRVATQEELAHDRAIAAELMQRVGA